MKCKIVEVKDLLKENAFIIHVAPSAFEWLTTIASIDCWKRIGWRVKTEDRAVKREEEIKWDQILIDYGNILRWWTLITCWESGRLASFIEVIN